MTAKTSAISRSESKSAATARLTKSPSPSLPMIEATERDIDVGRHRALLFRHLEGLDELVLEGAVERRLHLGDLGIARRLRPDFEAELRLVAHAVVEVPAAEFAEGGDEVAAALAHLGKLVREADAVALAEPGDQRVLRREVAVEVAGAHPGLRRHVLHGRAVEAGAGEAALGGVEDVFAPFGRDFIGGSTRRGRVHRAFNGLE